MTISDLTLIVALPLATLLQRSFRHAQLLNEARADAKTGLLNAATWEREAAAEVARAVRTPSPLAVALLDLDRFKQINDTHGHLLGDEVLRAIAAHDDRACCASTTWPAGSAARSSSCCCRRPARPTRSASPSASARTSRGCRSTAARRRARSTVTASIGVAALDAGSSRELTELLAAADAALYRAKASGRDQVQMISTSRGLSAVRRPRDDRPTRRGAGPAGARSMADDDSGRAAAVLLRRAPRPRPSARSTPTSSDSTATTSALAV